MFATDELEALALGSRWVARQGDTKLSLAARNALAKIAHVLPINLREELDMRWLRA
jgi:predicted DNA-binding transcriptional regulator YafY